MLFLLATAFAADPAAIDTYRQQRLIRSAYTVTDDTVTLAERWDPKFAPTEWGVFTGAGTLLNAEAFAIEVSDHGMQARLEKLQAKADTRHGLTTVAAIVAVSAGSALGASGAPQVADTMSPPQEWSATWVRIREDHPVARFYTAAMADELIIAHNAALRRDLGLSAEEVASVGK